MEIVTLRGCESTSKGLTPKASDISGLGCESCLEGLAPFQASTPAFRGIEGHQVRAWRSAGGPTRKAIGYRLGCRDYSSVT